MLLMAVLCRNIYEPYYALELMIQLRFRNQKPRSPFRGLDYLGLKSSNSNNGLTTFRQAVRQASPKTVKAHMSPMN
jgi:hypothetical protein